MSARPASNSWSSGDHMTVTGGLGPRYWAGLKQREKLWSCIAIQCKRGRIIGSGTRHPARTVYRLCRVGSGHIGRSVSRIVFARDLLKRQFKVRWHKTSSVLMIRGLLRIKLAL